MAACILIAEDNEANLALVEYLLKAAGHQTLAATEGAEAVRLVRQARPDLVVCDLQMPVLDGYAVLAQVRDDPALRDVPVIALTAYSSRSDRTSVLVAGFDGYLSKPIDPETFVAQIEKYLRPELRSGGVLRRS
ncbi:MAG TPA: response regulator [Burkholderiaceae bacterium]|jgi:two-component system cell cycle response regulator DivK|nr:response regulator [Burkholderiaceae bacterium]